MCLKNILLRSLPILPGNNELTPIVQETSESRLLYEWMAQCSWWSAAIRRLCVCWLITDKEELLRSHGSGLQDSRRFFPHESQLWSHHNQSVIYYFCCWSTTFDQQQCIFLSLCLSHLTSEDAVYTHGYDGAEALSCGIIIQAVSRLQLHYISDKIVVTSLVSIFQLESSDLVW